MEWVIVKGVYKQGMIEPLERLPGREGTEVLVLFPEPAPRRPGRGIWQQIKQEMVKEMPDLADQPLVEQRREFDRLSRMIAERLPYGSPEEFERAMRRDQPGDSRKHGVKQAGF